MKYVRYVGVLVAATVAMSAVGVASASAAEPEFKPKGGAFPVAFTSTSGEKILRTKAHEIKCHKDSDSGKITSPREDEVTVIFEECSLVGGGECTNKGAGAKKIETKLLASKLVWLDAANKVVGLALSAKAGTLATFECEAPLVGKVQIEVTGSVIGVIKPLNVMTKEFELEFKCEAGKPEKQAWTAYEEPPGTKIEDKLTTNIPLLGAKEESCEEETPNDIVTLANAEEGEIIA